MSKTKEIEEWKSLDFIGFPDYEVSNFGNVKSLNYKRSGKEKIMKQSKNKNGYLQLALWKNGKYKRYLVHRLVATAFLPNPDNLPCVNHKDENKGNNHVDNLEMCTHIYNMNYGTKLQRQSEKMKGKFKGENHPMYGKHRSEETKQKISNGRKGKYCGENNPMYGKQHTEETKQKMSIAMKGKQLSEETKQKMSITRKGKPQYKHRKPILQFTLDNVFVRDWDSAKSASIELNINSGFITAVCKGKHKSAYGFIWKYKN